LAAFVETAVQAALAVREQRRADQMAQRPKTFTETLGTESTLSLPNLLERRAMIRAARKRAQAKREAFTQFVAELTVSRMHVLMGLYGHSPDAYGNDEPEDYEPSDDLLEEYHEHISDCFAHLNRDQLMKELLRTENELFPECVLDGYMLFRTHRLDGALGELMIAGDAAESVASGASEKA